MKQAINRIWNPEMECMDIDVRREMQSQKLRETVKRVYDNVEMYRSRMIDAGITPDDIKTVDDLSKLPFTDKPDLRDQFPYGLFASPRKDIVRIQGSSGTTGMPIVSGYTQQDIDDWTEMVTRSVAAAGGSDEDIVQVTYGYGLFTGGLGLHQGASNVGAMVVPMSSGNTVRQINMMKGLGVTMIGCTPSYALHIGETIREMGLDIKDFKLKAGIFGAEPWSDNIRNRIEDLLQIDALDIYGLTEICGPGVSFECLEKVGMHVNEDFVIPEIIDPDTLQPLPYGELGELVFSTIGKQGMPMLRYRTHDLCRLHPEKCACGRTTVRMERIIGRTDDMLIIRGVNVFPSQVETVLTNIRGVSPHFLMVVDREGSTDRLEIQVEVTEEMMGDTISAMQVLQKEIGEKVKSTLGVAARIKLVDPKTIPRFEGKARRVTDNRIL
ncbi:phenylacetate--CoA ligase [Eubacteriales bacterium OttesenSCG-928-N13]|nr:phenylacetate--CoA ligase [Eubacteriales bacterium OttesenSCG-928-N13]